MQLRLLHIVALSGVLGLSACVTPIAEHIPLAPSSQASVGSTDLVMPIAQSEIYVVVPASNVSAATGGGLLGALIDAGVDSSRTKKAQAAIKPLRDAVVDLDIDTILRDDLKASLSTVNWLHVNGARVVKTATPASLDQTITDSKEGAVLVVSVDYHLSVDASTLEIVVSANMYANNAALTAVKPKGGRGAKSDISNAIYRNTVTYKATVANATGDRDHNIAAWAANNGEPLRAALRESSAKVAKMMASDIDGQMTAMRGKIGGGTVPTAALGH